MIEDSSPAELTDADLKALPDGRTRAEALGIDWGQLVAARNRLAVGSLLVAVPFFGALGVLSGLGLIFIAPGLGGAALGMLSILVYVLAGVIVAHGLRSRPAQWRQAVGSGLGIAVQVVAWAVLVAVVPADPSWALAVACGAAAGQIALNYITQSPIIRLLHRGAPGTVATVSALREFPAEGTLLGGRVKSMIVESAARGVLAFSSCVILAAVPLAAVAVVIVIALIEGVSNYLAVGGRARPALAVMIAAAVVFAVAAIILG